jgi:hypothetical protein
MFYISFFSTFKKGGPKSTFRKGGVKTSLVLPFLKVKWSQSNFGFTFLKGKVESKQVWFYLF